MSDIEEFVHVFAAVIGRNVMTAPAVDQKVTVSVRGGDWHFGIIAKLTGADHEKA
jgi:uncharacterized linocin/CFP29 family protein